MVKKASHGTSALQPERASELPSTMASKGLSSPLSLSWLKVRAHGKLLIVVKAKPNAAKSRILGPNATGDALEIALAARPQDGEANEELLCFLKETLRVPRSSLSLIKGETSRLKQVEISGQDEAKVARALLSAGESHSPGKPSQEPRL